MFIAAFLQIDAAELCDRTDPGMADARRFIVGAGLVGFGTEVPDEAARYIDEGDKRGRQ
ncbi:MAG: hypothetical protein IJ926_06255 [Firmicutes bacterium]|nr:hypothetical protein [Bacillota bacterium]